MRAAGCGVGVGLGAGVGEATGVADGRAKASEGVAAAGGKLALRLQPLAANTSANRNNTNRLFISIPDYNLARYRCQYNKRLSKIRPLSFIGSLGISGVGRQIWLVG